MNFWYIQRLWSQEENNLHLNSRVRASSSNMELDIFLFEYFNELETVNEFWVVQLQYF